MGLPLLSVACMLSLGNVSAAVGLCLQANDFLLGYIIAKLTANVALTNMCLQNVVKVLSGLSE